MLSVQNATAKLAQFPHVYDFMDHTSHSVKHNWHGYLHWEELSSPSHLTGSTLWILLGRCESLKLLFTRGSNKTSITLTHAPCHSDSQFALLDIYKVTEAMHVMCICWVTGWLSTKGLSYRMHMPGHEVIYRVCMWDWVATHALARIKGMHRILPHHSQWCKFKT